MGTRKISLNRLIKLRRRRRDDSSTSTACVRGPSSEIAPGLIPCLAAPLMHKRWRVDVAVRTAG